MTGSSVVKMHFTSEGEYADTVENVTVEMVKKERSPFWVALGDEKLEHFLNRKKFEAAETGWYYSQSKRAVLVKYLNPKKETTLTPNALAIIMRLRSSGIVAPDSQALTDVLRLAPSMRYPN